MTEPMAQQGAMPDTCYEVAAMDGVPDATAISDACVASVDAAVSQRESTGRSSAGM